MEIIRAALLRDDDEIVDIGQLDDRSQRELQRFVTKVRLAKELLCDNFQKKHLCHIRVDPAERQNEEEEGTSRPAHRQ